MSFSEALLPEFDQEMANTRKLLACVPEQIPAYKPHEKSMTMQRLAGHIGELPSWAVNTIRLTTLDLTPPGGSGFKPFLASTRTELLETFDKHVADARAAIAGATDDDLHVVWSLVYQGKTVLQTPRMAVLRSIVMNHIIHHRAQLGVYLRLNNIAIPGMYGPSADDAKAFGV